jgi:chromosome segregation ATPase
VDFQVVHLQIDFITGQQQAAEEKADSLTEDLAAVNTRLTQAQQELEGKEEKLALMEGGSCHTRFQEWAKL